MAEDRKTASEQEVLVSITLLAIVITVFALIITINPELFSRTLFTTQIALSIPFLLASTFGRIKLASTNDHRWEDFGFIYWILGYACFINTLGILLAVTISPTIGLLFFATNIIVPLSYSWIAISLDPAKTSSRIRKDLFFVAMLLVFGLLPALGAF